MLNENIDYTFREIDFDYLLMDNQAVRRGLDYSILNYVTMSRLKQSRNIDRLYKDIRSIRESQCSLSDEDQACLDQALSRLDKLKRKKGRTNEQILSEITEVIALIVKYLS